MEQHERTPSTMPVSVPKREPKRKVGIRADGKLWDEARAIAHDRGEYMSEVVEAALRAYIKKYGKKQ